LGRVEEAEKYVKEQIFEKPSEYFTIEKLRKSAKVDRRISIWEVLQYGYGYIPYFKSKDELLEDEFELFDTTYLPDEQYFLDAKNFFKSYVSDNDFREIIESKKFALLSTNPNGNLYRNLTPELRKLIPEYIKDNISLNQFMA
jgi:type I restriction enzyme, R subunit